MELSPLISSVACSSTTSDNRDSYLNVGRGEATPSSSGNRQRLGQATPSPSSCKPPAATSSSSGRRRKATEYTPSTDMGGMCLDTPTTSKKRRMLRRQRVGVTTRVPPFMPTPSRSPWTSSTRSTPSTRNDAVPPHVSPGVAAAAARSLAPRALVWSYQEDDHPLALDGDAAAAAADADAAAVAAEEASASRQVPDTTTSEQRDDNEHPDAPKSRWAELISAMKGSQVMRGLTRLAAELRARLGIDFSVNETMDKVVKQIKLKALLTTVYRFFHEENSSMKDLFEEYFEPRKQK
ncbi:unnamed protein product [Trichogramma brassicae]|uniref:Uncharacterized protein n=1 Tax=Trichogramma brassicae TaxID=86971 RepID=A0A6H5IMR6_9HYME|nr:unnamed protein product [Trichogramma brassicae]